MTALSDNPRADTRIARGGAIEICRLAACLVGAFLIAACDGAREGEGNVQPPIEPADDGPVLVEIRGEKGNFQLFRGGEPYTVKGVGLAVDHASPWTLIRTLAEHGGNSFRTWHVIDRKFLDFAHAHGISVAVCLDMQKERHGFDYNDERSVADQLKLFRKQVLELRDHPALLFWIIGNELNYGYANPRVYDAVNDVAEMIHEVDPYHLTTTTTAGITVELAREIRSRAPALDFISVQVYGGLLDLKSELDAIGLDKPVAITEWGTIGHWEVDQTDWGAPIELNSREKADFYERGHREVLEPLQGHLIASYAFLWAQKQERTATWYGMFTDRLEPTPPMDVMYRLWNGRWPEDRAPSIGELRLNDLTAHDSVRVSPGSDSVAYAPTSDEWPDALSYRWSVMPESTSTKSGGDTEEALPELKDLVTDLGDGVARVRSPDKPGAYRLYVYVQDRMGAVAHANLPFYVEKQQE